MQLIELLEKLHSNLNLNGGLTAEVELSLKEYIAGNASLTHERFNSILGLTGKIDDIISAVPGALTLPEISTAMNYNLNALDILKHTKRNKLPTEAGIKGRLGRLQRAALQASLGDATLATQFADESYNNLFFSASVFGDSQRSIYNPDISAKAFHEAGQSAEWLADYHLALESSVDLAEKSAVRDARTGWVELAFDSYDRGALVSYENSKVHGLNLYAAGRAGYLLVVNLNKEQYLGPARTKLRKFSEFYQKHPDGSLVAKARDAEAKNTRLGLIS